MRKTIKIGVIFLLLTMMVVTADALAQDAGSSGPVVDGSTSLRYRARWTDDDDDHDLYQYAVLHWGREETDTISIHLSGRGSWDLDGDRESDGHYVFDSVADTYDSRVTGQLLTAYGNLNLKNMPIATVRAGRQYVEEGETMHFDGGRVDSRVFKNLKNLQLSIYGGVPVHLYESSPEWDAIFGIGVQANPVERGRARVDWQRVRDRTDFYGDETTDLATLSGWYSVCEALDLHGRMTFIESDDRDAYLRATMNLPDKGWLVQASFFNQFKTLKDYAIEFDPFFSSIKTYYPYYQTTLTVTKDLPEIWKTLFIGAGVTVREVVEQDDVGPYNREFERYYLSPAVRDLFLDGLEIALTGEIWNGDDQDIATWGVDLRKRWDDRWTTSLGTAYALYKYDYYADRERDHVRSTYGKVEYRLLKSLKATLQYAFENDDDDDYQTVEAGLQWHF